MFSEFIHLLPYDMKVEGAHEEGWQGGEHRVGDLELTTLRQKERRVDKSPFTPCDKGVGNLPLLAWLGLKEGQGK
jgi:hypothetical protein